MTDDTIVQAAAKAIRIALPLRTSPSEIARAVLEAVEPLIRADQREKDAALIDGEAVQFHDAWLLRWAASIVRGAEPTPATSDRSSR